MLGSGLLDEVRALYGRGLADTPTASQAIGYKELFPFLRGEAALGDLRRSGQARFPPLRQAAGNLFRPHPRRSVSGNRGREL